MELVAALGVGFVAAMFAPVLVRRLRGTGARLTALVPLALTAYFATQVSGVTGGEAPSISWEWIPALDVTLTLRLDGLALLMALLIEGLGTLVFLYAASYLAGDARQGRFYGWLFLFKASMLGVVLSADVVSLLIFWELTSISSFMLIGHESEEEGSRSAALQALLITVAGGQALLVGVIVLSWIGGGTSFDQLRASADVIRASPLYLPALLCILFAAVTKSAQMPFHIWLPSAMAAPTPVSAFLHSATMVKAGVFLLLRIHPVLGETESWTALLTSFGLVTLVIGAWVGIAKTDLKQVLAYATIAALGGLTFLIGIGTPAALHAALVFLVGHALYKGSLFLTAGAIDHSAGTRDVRELSGLARKMPFTAAAGFVAAVSMMGLIPALGFIGKEGLYEVALGTHWGFAAATTLGFIAMGALALIAGVRPFLGAPSASAGAAHEGGVAITAGPLILAALGLMLGVFPASVSLLIASAASAIQGTAVTTTVKLWHGWGLPLGLSAASLLLGVGLFAASPELRRRIPSLPRFVPTPVRIYAGSLVALDRVARSLTSVIQSGQLRRYNSVVLLALAGLVIVPLIGFSSLARTPNFGELRLHELAALIVAVVGAFTAVLTRSIITAVVALGTVGFAESTIYLFFSAPDLALTQIVVQILTLVFIALLLIRKPGVFKTFADPRPLPVLIAALAAGSITAILSQIVGQPPHRELAGTFATLSVPGAHGRNLVNTILVDFRSFDTLGEIAMLMAAGVGVLALMRFGSAREPR